MVGTAIKYKEEEEEEGVLGSENEYISKRGVDLSFRPHERIGADDDDEEELRKSRKNYPMMAGQHRLWGKPEVGMIKQTYHHCQ